VGPDPFAKWPPKIEHISYQKFKKIIGELKWLNSFNYESQVIDIVNQVLSNEAPMFFDLFCDRIVKDVFQAKKVSGPAETRLLALLKFDVIASNFTYDQTTGIIWQKGAEKEKYTFFRPPQGKQEPRDISLIPREEIQNAFLFMLCRARVNGHQRKTLLEDVLKRIGYEPEKPCKKERRILNEVLDKMLKRGFCKLNDKFNIVLGEPPFLPDEAPAVPPGQDTENETPATDEDQIVSDTACQDHTVNSAEATPEPSEVELKSALEPESGSDRISVLLNPADPESYNQFISRCSEALKARDIPMMHVSRAEIVLRELIVISAGRTFGQSDKLIEVSCTFLEDKVVINVVDSSSGFDSVVSLSQIRESIGLKVRESGFSFHPGSINDDISFVDGGHCARAVLSLKIN